MGDTGQSHSSMAKVFVLLAWACLASAAPQFPFSEISGSPVSSVTTTRLTPGEWRTVSSTPVLSSPVSTRIIASPSPVTTSRIISSPFDTSVSGFQADNSGLVSSVLSKLDIQGAVANALRGGAAVRGTVTTVSRPAVSVKFSSQNNEGFSNSASAGNTNTIVNNVMSALSPVINRAVANALSSSTTSSTSSSFDNNVNSFSSTGSSFSSSSVSSNEESRLVQQIITMLTPSISKSVAEALAGQTVSQQTFTSNYFSSTQSIDRESIAMKVLDALEPTIAAQVSSAIESMRATQIAQLRKQVTVSQSQTESLVNQIVVTLTPTIRSAVHSALKTQAEQKISALAAQTTQIDQASLVRQILNILRPQVISAVNDVISAQEAAERQAAALREQQRQAALREQQRLEAERQAALLAAQQQQTASGDLSSLFGSGHEVVHEVPGQTKVEYHIGVGQPAQIGFTPTKLQRPTFG